MNKATNYFLWLFAILFFASCTEEGEDLIPDNINPDTKSSALTFLVDGVDSTEITQKAGESVSFVVVVSYGDENPGSLVLLSNGKEIQAHSLANAPATVKITYDIPADTAISKILLTAELRKESTGLVSDDFTVNVLADDTEKPVAVDTASITLQVDGTDSKQTNQTAGETATFMVAINYGDTGADLIIITNANNGEKIKEVSLATTPVTVEISYDIVATTAAGDINLKIELLKQNEPLDSDTFIITVEESEEPVLTISALIEGDSEFSIFAQALAQTGLAEDLKEEGPFTVFAPTDGAFETFMDNLGIERNELLARSDLADMLRYHITKGRFVSDEIKDGQTAKTQLGLDISFEVTGEVIKVDEVKLESMDLTVSNGVVHRVGKVLLPQSNLALYSSVLLIHPTADDTSESFFNTSNGQRYSKADVEDGSNEISRDIDFGFYYGATNEASLSSPDQYPEGFYDLTTWETLNNTKFRPVADGFTAEDFSSYSPYTPSMLYDSAKAEDEAGRITNLQVGDIFAFQTSDGRYGLLLIDDIEPAFSSEDGITISVKVEKK